jgi:hypothetical protein
MITTNGGGLEKLNYKINMEYYIVERRKGDGIVENSDCFLSNSIESVIAWINKNKDFDLRNYYWWWAVIKIKIDDEFGGEVYKYFDWDGNELEQQPINNYISTDMTEKNNIFECFSDEKFILNVCYSFRHDFGLLSKDEQDLIRFECKEWMRAIKNNYK